MGHGSALCMPVWRRQLLWLRGRFSTSDPGAASVTGPPVLAHSAPSVAHLRHAIPGTRPMNICVLQPSYEGSTFDYQYYDPPRDLSPLLPEHTVCHAFLKKVS